MMRPARSLAALLLLTLVPPVSGQDSSELWLLVRSAQEEVATLSWKRIGEAYLSGRKWELADPKSAAARPATSRLVVGTPDTHPDVRAAAAGVGVAFEGDQLTFRGRTFAAGTGFATFADDPDGGGSLFLICGPDEESVLACFKIRLNLGNTSYVFVRDGQVLETGRLGLVFDTREPRVVRLDRDLEYLLTTGASLGNEIVIRAARGLAGYGFVFGTQDMVPLMEQILTDQASLTRAREVFARRDVGKEVVDAWLKCAEAFGGRTPVAPVFYVTFGPVDGTNARGFGYDTITGRFQVMYNLTALAKGDHARAAFVHEAVHTFQDLSGARLIDRVVIEGVACLASEELVPDLAPVDALLWNDEDLAAAEERRDEILAAFADVAETTDDETLYPWMQLGVPLDAVPGAPSRCGYYLGWLAARAWLEADPERDLAGLLRAAPEDVLGAL